MFVRGKFLRFEQAIKAIPARRIDDDVVDRVDGVDRFRRRHPVCRVQIQVLLEREIRERGRPQNQHGVVARPREGQRGCGFAR